ncbi:hypothetical protein ACRYCC_25300 [Actinomadura scrupuli]|uniref:hypothetical protein n=1 Tax=Actinomadura scrupuli TaxID=559629 RepID=UPI003D96EED9
MRAISIKQPWGWAVARGHRKVSNQPMPTAYRGPLLVHASMRVDLDSCHSPLIRAAGWDPRDPLATLGAVIAVAELAGVCSAAVDGTPCDCGPWAEPGTHHWRLTAIRALSRPVVSLGWLGLWEPQPTLVAEVLAKMAVDDAHATPLPAG